jgi:hypothetical protein
MSGVYEGTGVEYVESDMPVPCLICGTATTRIDVDFEGRLCSTKCMRTIEAAYRAALAGAADDASDHPSR